MPNINVEIPAELHKKLKSLAVEKGMHLKTIIPEALEQYVKNEKEKIKKNEGQIKWRR